MDVHGTSTGRNGSLVDQPPEWPPAGHQTGIQEFYPERPGLMDCAYYMRTGSCSYGSKCRYNHPRDRRSVVAVGTEIGEYPSRAGEPSCQFYLRTGTCKFGVSCKFDHPRLADGSLINLPVNSYGYPLRPDEKECSYYSKTGQCKFGVACIFNHPQPSDDISIAKSARPVCQIVQSPSYETASTGHRVARPTLLSASYVPNAYGTMLLPVPNWSPHLVGPKMGPMRPELSSDAQASVYGVTKLPSSAPAYTGSYPPLSNTPMEKVFPERPGQLKCEYYMKTGDCKFGSSCRYHHPPDWKTNCVLSSAGLPFRPGVQACTFYLQKGHCKFGRTCKFDHPMGGVTSIPPASSLTNIRFAPPFASSIAPLISLPQLSPVLLSGSKLDRPHLSRLPYPATTTSVGLIYAHGSPTSRLRGNILHQI